KESWSVISGAPHLPVSTLGSGSVSGSDVARSAALPQQYPRRVLQVGNNQESLRMCTRGGSSGQSLERTDRLNDPCSVRIGLQDRQRHEFSEWRMVGLCEVHLILRLGRKPCSRDLNQVQQPK